MGALECLESGGRAVQGASDVLDTLAEGRGQLLLVHDDPGSVAEASWCPFMALENRKMGARRKRGRVWIPEGEAPLGRDAARLDPM